MRTILVVMLVAGSALGLLWAAQRRLIYFPDRLDPGPAAQALPGGRDVELATADGLRLRAWLAPPERADPRADRPADPRVDRGMAVLVAPGNAGSRAGRVPLARALSAEGFTVLLLDYRGYGGNPGTPGAAGLARDVRAAAAYLTGTPGLAPRGVLYLGESLGAAVVTELATEVPPAGLVLRSPFADLAAVGRHHYPYLPVGALLRERYPVADLVGRIDAPTVVVYGDADTVVPPGHSRTVADRCANLVDAVTVPAADHNDAVLVHGPPLIAAVAALADRVAAQG